MVKRFVHLSPRFVMLSCAVVALVVASVFAVSAGITHASPKTSSASIATHASRGQLVKVQTVNVSQLGHVAASTAGSAQPRVAPLRPRPITGPHTSLVRQPPTVAAGPLAKAGSLLANFDGVNEIQNSAASNTPLEPPDEGLAAGNGYVLNVVNVTGAIYNAHGVTLAGPFALYALFGESPTANLSDPRAFYDNSTHTWFANLFEYGGNNNTESHIDLAVNTGNPVTGTWTIYRIDTTEPQDANCPCFPDYTIFGIDQYNVYLSGNEFSLSNSVFNGAEVFAISKAQLVAGASSVNFVRFGELSMAGAPAYHVQPAISYSSPAAEYFLSSLDPNSTFDNRLGLWAMTNRQSVTTGVGMPVLSSVILSSEAYGFPVNVPTPPGYNTFLAAPTTGIVTPDFDAMQEVEYIHGTLVGALNTSVTIPGDTSTRDGIAWLQVAPQLYGQVVSSASKVKHQGYIAVQGEYLLYPHINQVADGNMVVTFSIGGPSTYLSAAYAVKSASAKNFGVVQVAGAGTGPDNGFTMTAAFGGVGRWGDYSNGEIDYATNQVWLATQYIPNSGDVFANWGNRIFEVQL